MTDAQVINEEPGKRLPPRPEWLDDEPEIVAVLNAFLDKLDHKPISERARTPSIPLSKTLVPALHRNNESADRSWELLRSLEGLVFNVRLSRKRQPYDPEYLGASLRFLEEAEAVCRDWLARPRQERYQVQWVASVEAHADAFADRGASLCVRPVKVAGKSAQQVVDAFARMSAFAASTLTLRQLSGRIFWGHSKVLDAREDLLRQLYPGFVLAPRPVLLHVYLPTSCKGVLFVENQDTYINALARRPAEVAGLALVYGAGFRGSAERIRTRDGVSLHYQGASDRGAQVRFDGWWFGEGAVDWPIWFWGDLDYSGMAILKSLRQRFGDVRAWRPGYEPMMRLLREGAGHAPDTADKADQIDPGMTGCAYADQSLLPVMREIGAFVDQEAV